MIRIAVGGLQHETNTFSPVPATLQDFLDGGGWPALLEGMAVIDVTAPMNLPIAGAVEAAREAGVATAPVLWAAATPSGPVEQAAFDSIAQRFLGRLQAIGPIDGLYLDLHGAMVTTGDEDGEGEFLERVRAQVGPGLPIVVSLDLHANVSERMFRLSDALLGYRTYPHVDMGTTGARAMELLIRIARTGLRPAKAMRRLDFLVTLTSQTTLAPPAQQIYAQLEEIESKYALDALSWTGGFALADTADCGQSVLAYSATQSSADIAAGELAAVIESKESAFSAKLWSAEEAVRFAMDRVAQGSMEGPIVLADTQDNPGGGGTGDSTGLLHSLVASGAKNAVVAMIRDPEVAAQAHSAGNGATISLVLGGKSFPGMNGPWHGHAKVEKLSAGKFAGTGPMWGGSPIDLGLSALVEIDGVKVIVCTNKMQAADQSILRHFELRPEQIGILVLKSSVHFRADFQAVASEVLIVKSPGTVTADLRELPYQRLRPGIRLPRG